MSFDPGPPVKKKSKLALILGILAVSAIAGVVCCGGAAWFGVGMFTAPRDAAIAAMGQDAEISGKLGTPLQAGGRFSLSNYTNNNNTGSASIGFDVVGPNGNANVDADMKLTAGTWTVNSLTVTYGDGSKATLPRDGVAVPAGDAELVPQQ